jgi:hypothetical protein
MITLGLASVEGLVAIGAAAAPDAITTSGDLSLTPGRSVVVDSGMLLRSGRATTAFTVPGPSAGGGLYVGLETGVQDGSAYLAKTHILSDGRVSVGLSKLSGHTEKRFGSVAVKGLKITGPSTVNVEVSMTRTSSVRLAVRVWTAGVTRPDWQYRATDYLGDSSATAGKLRPWAYLSGTAQRNVVVHFAGLSRVEVPALVTPAPTRSATPTSTPTPTKTIEPAPTTTTTRSTTTSTPTPTRTTPTTGVVPGEGNTGVPAGTTVTQHRGDLVITRAGATYDKLDIHGFVDVQAANVKITNSIIRGGVATSYRGVINSTSSAAKNFVLEDSEIIPEHPDVKLDGIIGGNYTLRRVEIDGGVDTAKAFKDNVSIQSSWLHGTQYFLHDANQSGGPTHNDGVQVLGGTNISLTGNLIEGANNAALMVSQTTAPTVGLVIKNNWLRDGGCTVNIVPKNLSSIGPITMTGNVFGGTTRVAGCAVARTASTTLLASNNIDADSGLPAKINVWN